MLFSKTEVDLTGWKYKIRATGNGYGRNKQWRAYITDPDNCRYGSSFGMLDYCLVYGKTIEKAEKETLKKIRKFEIDRKSVRDVTL